MIALAVPVLGVQAAAGPIIAIDQTTAVGSARAVAEASGLSRSDILVLIVGILMAALFLRGRWRRLRRVPRRPLLFMPPLGLGLFLAMLVLGQIGILAARSLSGMEIAPDQPMSVMEQVQLTLGLYAAQALVIAGYASRLRRVPKPAPDRRAAPPVAALFGAAGLVQFWPMAIAITSIASMLVMLMGGRPPDVIAHGTLDLLRSAEIDVWFVALTGLVIVVGPIAEEVMYRGLLQETLGRAGLSRWGAIAATSVLFTGMHFDAVAPHALPGLFVLSLGFGWVFEKSGRLSAAIAMHMLFNLGNIMMAFVLV